MTKIPWEVPRKDEQPQGHTSKTTYTYNQLKEAVASGSFTLEQVQLLSEIEKVMAITKEPGPEKDNENASNTQMGNACNPQVPEPEVEDPREADLLEREEKLMQGFELLAEQRAIVNEEFAESNKRQDQIIKIFELWNQIITFNRQLPYIDFKGYNSNGGLEVYIAPNEVAPIWDEILKLMMAFVGIEEEAEEEEELEAE